MSKERKIKDELEEPTPEELVDESIYKALREFYTLNKNELFLHNSNLPFITDLDKNELKNIRVIEVSQSYFKDNYDFTSNVLDTLRVAILEYNVSKKRLGRTEAMEVLKQAHEGLSENNGFFGRFREGFKR